jgi:putative phosphoesterase
LKENKTDIFCFAGDMSADITLTIKILREIREELDIEICAVTGNHEMWDKNFANSFEILSYFDNQAKDISVHANPFEFGDWVILGNMGWYDYSTAQTYFTEEQLDKMIFGSTSWNDKVFCNWDGKTNKEVANLLLKDLKEQLEVYKGKNMILLSHIVPYEECVLVKNDKGWDYFNAFIGNVNIGKLADEYGVKIAHFGHTHFRHWKRSNGGVEMICTPLGYYGEWHSITRNIKEEIEKCVPIYEL